MRCDEKRDEQLNRNSALRVKRRSHGVLSVRAGADGEVRGLVAHLKLRLDLGRHPGQDRPEGHTGSVVGDGEAAGREGWRGDTESAAGLAFTLKCFITQKNIHVE